MFESTNEKIVSARPEAEQLVYEPFVEEDAIKSKEQKQRPAEREVEFDKETESVAVPEQKPEVVC